MYAVYKSRPVEVKAYQFTGDTLNSPGVIVSNGHPSVITQNANIARVNIGDWIVQEPDGVHHYPVQDAIFKKRWTMKPPEGVGKVYHEHKWFRVVQITSTGVLLECACGIQYRLERDEWSKFEKNPPSVEQFYHLRMEESAQKN